MNSEKTFEEVELDELETVVGGGRIWNKIKHKLKDIGEKILEEGPVVIEF